jgi:AraC family transcriptional regulator
MALSVEKRTLISSVAGDAIAMNGLVADGAIPARHAGVRETTRAMRQDAIERVIDTMRDRVAEPLSLDEMGRVAMFSPYHFHRAFRAVTGRPPAQYLLSLRMATACRLLLTTQMRVIDVCYEVGFGSLGTFTTRFGRLVGAPPQQLRRLAARHASRPMATLATADDRTGSRQDRSVTGWIDTPPGRTCITMIGVFDCGSSHGPPAACAVVRAPGPFAIGPLPPGCYHVLAAGFPMVTVLEAMHVERHLMLIGAHAGSVRYEPGMPSLVVDLELRPPSAVDPPIVLAAPILMAERTDPSRWFVGSIDTMRLDMVAQQRLPAATPTR